MDILVTGGTGFIGRNLNEYFSQYYNVLSPSHKELEILDEDAAKDYFQKNIIDVVIHGAVKPGHRNSKDSSNQFYNNTRMFFNIVRNLSKSQKMIFLSSGSVYDMRYYMPKMKEEYFNTHVPIDEVGFSKYIVAKYIEKSENIVELRIFGVFGKHEDYAIRFISNAICKALFSLPITIKQNRRFDYIYINDLMPIVDYFIHNKANHKAFNVTPDKSIELYELAEKVRSISENKVSIEIAQTGIGVEYSGDNSRLRNEIKDIKFTNIDVAIKELYEWYREHKTLINKDFLLVDK